MSSKNQKEITNEILQSLYRQYTMIPSVPLPLNEIVNNYGWGAKETAEMLFKGGWAMVSNHPLEFGNTQWSAILTNKGVKEIDPYHFVEQIQNIESYLFYNENEEEIIGIASQMSEPTRVLNLTSELKLHGQFIVNNEKRTVKLRDDYYHENKSDGSFM